jgi:hypothetical protein
VEEVLVQTEISAAKSKAAAKAKEKPKFKIPISEKNKITASSANAAEPLRKKFSRLQEARSEAVRTETLPDGRIRYYEAEVPANTPGETRGRCPVTEYNPRSGNVRYWQECHGHDGKVLRVHPKFENGLDIDGPHYPLTGKDKLIYKDK